ncbi:hypothetical protein [Siansivirga zeaxanthinifaciens]|uniref:Lipoprotein n=1 Tax=Siansivirga zeaxanthinifaciens CC-SAMT-1 TaxID=1454006 RepID=A0A0C5W9H2_9FLAO|nr:hypothetical protein [Siansivirga zeaxanthinifaciens]AJR03758.1 hypothetical protein AW14_09135 [Siansivirga zeaxanthinifaciens CC-SAMT-1]
MIRICIAFVLCGMLVTSCKDKKEAAVEEETVVEEVMETPQEVAEEPAADQTYYVPQSVNDDLAEKLKTYITTSYVAKADLDLLTENDRQFQFYQIDLNNDGQKEVIINFMTPYFCGSGGCSMVLLSSDLKPITKFTVTRTPLYAENAMKNGWKVILTRSQGELKELVYNGSTYPSNPSMVKKAPYDAPSGEAEIMFDENFSNAKTYKF